VFHLKLWVRFRADFGAAFNHFIVVFVKQQQQRSGKVLD
jgi:hypothetical protein